MGEVFKHRTVRARSVCEILYRKERGRNLRLESHDHGDGSRRGLVDIVKHRGNRWMIEEMCEFVGWLVGWLVLFVCFLGGSFVWGFVRHVSRNW